MTTNETIAKFERTSPVNPDQTETVSVEYDAFIKRFFLSIPMGVMGYKQPFTRWGEIIAWANANGFKFTEVNVA